jgi:hypothetical protein
VVTHFLAVHAAVPLLAVVDFRNESANPIIEAMTMEDATSKYEEDP